MINDYGVYMLNPTFSTTRINTDEKKYILSKELYNAVINTNKNFLTGKELRLQKVYQDEIWIKLNSININKDYFNNKKVLDICCGTGFLSYHLLSVTKLKEITLMDISPTELNESKKLISEKFPNIKSDFVCGDVTKSNLPDNEYDVIIGNSFLHHLYNVPMALKEFNRLLKPGGQLIIIHEPTIAAIPLESGSLLNILKYIMKGWIMPKNLNIDYQCQGTDVWLFNSIDLKEILISSGFKELNFINWHFFRPIIVSKLSLHLNDDKYNLNKYEVIVLSLSIYFDSVINKILPTKFFGSFCFSAKKPPID
jgi:ubiquinone/menaquinone biosynthesis C-methylase UbiE